MSDDPRPALDPGIVPAPLTRDAFTPVPPVGELPPALRRPELPNPSFGWAIVWCIGFVLFTQVPAGALATVVLIFWALAWPTSLPTETLSNASALIQTDAFSVAMMVAMGSAQVLVIGLSLLSLRLVNGRHWGRVVALRLPGLGHTLLALAAFPALVLLANGSYEAFKSARGGLANLEVVLGERVGGAGGWLGPAALGAAGLFFLLPQLLGEGGWTRGRREPGTWGHAVLSVLTFLGVGLLTHGAILGGGRLLREAGLFSDTGTGIMEEMVQVFSRWPWAEAVVIIGAGPGIGEELWCRGFLGRGLVGRYGPILGILLTSFFFGLIHVDPAQGTMAALLGICLHYVYQTGRSLLLPMLLHFLNNSLAVTITRFPGARAIEEKPEAIPVYVFVAAGFLLVAAAWALYANRARVVSDPEAALPWEPEFPGVEYPPPESGTHIQRGGSPGAYLLAGAAFLAFLAACAVPLWRGL